MTSITLKAKEQRKKISPSVTLTTISALQAAAKATGNSQGSIIDSMTAHYLASYMKN